MRQLALAFVLLLCAGQSLAQFAVPIIEIGPTTFFTCDGARDGLLVVGTDGLDPLDCLVGGGTAPPHVCVCDGGSGTWRADPDSGLYVQIAGDTMTGQLDMLGPNPRIIIGDGTEIDAAVDFNADTGRTWAVGVFSGPDEFTITNPGTGVREFTVTPTAVHLTSTGFPHLVIDEVGTGSVAIEFGQLGVPRATLGWFDVGPTEGVFLSGNASDAHLLIDTTGTATFSDGAQELLQVTSTTITYKGVDVRNHTERVDLSFADASFTTGVLTTIIWTEVEDTDGMFPGVSTTVTIQTAGTYYCTANLIFTGVGFQILGEIELNGTDTLGLCTSETVSSSQGCNVSFMKTLAVSDTLVSIWTASSFGQDPLVVVGSFSCFRVQ